MHCVKAPRVLRHKSDSQTSGAGDCWGNVSLITKTQARACGLLHEAMLCKKHLDEQVNQNKINCCFPLRDSNNGCSGSFVPCPRRLFPVFDCCQQFSHTGTFICEKHLLLADKDKRICDNEEYIPPKKRSKSESTKENPADSRELQTKIEDLKRQKEILEERQRETEERNATLLSKIEEITRQNTNLVKEQEKTNEMNDELRQENIILQKKLQGDTTFSTLVLQFHRAFTIYLKNGGNNLYDPNMMEEFCEQHAPGLFNDIFTAIYNNEKRQPSKKRTKLQRSRVVAVLHSLSFFRNQKNNMLQKANGLNLKFGGASHNSLMAGQVMGYSVHPNSVRNYQKELAEKNKKEVGKIIKTAIQEKSLIMLIEDDIHFIHASRQPTSSETSTAWHMCTALIDVQQSVSALPRPPAVQDLHRTVPVTIKNGTVKQCRGGIDVADIMNHFSRSICQFFESSYMSTLSPEHRNLDMTDARESCENLRVYSDEGRHELELLKSTWLIDEFEQSLKSVQHYKTTLEHILREAPELTEYLQHYAAVLTGDHPTWKYNKKIVAEWDAAADPASPVPSLVPWQGPFHVSLNSEESTVLLFRPFFEMLHKAIFGRNKVLPKRPKSHKIVTLTTAAFGGWTIIRNEVLHLFGPVCKDPEFMLFFNLFDEILPLIFYMYNTVFRGSDFHQWLDVLFRMSLVFITFRRRNYDKATLCQLSDLVYHIRENRALIAIIEQHLSSFTEKKVEIFHSVLRRNVPVWALPEEIRIMAHAISGRRFDHDFIQWFLPEYSRGRGRQNLALLVLASAEFLIDTFADVWAHQGQTEKIPKGRRKYQPYYFPTLDSTLDQRCLPLGYAFGQEPDPLLACDNRTCAANTDFEQEIVRLNCGHTFHRGCITKETDHPKQDHNYALTQEIKCPICYVLLQQRMEELTLTFNRYLAGEDDVDDDGDGNDDQNNPDDSDDESLKCDDDDEDSDSDFDEQSYHREIKKIQDKAISRFSNLQQRS